MSGAIFRNISICAVCLLGMIHEAGAITTVHTAVIQGSRYSDPGAEALDNVDGDLTARVDMKTYVDTSVVGTYPVWYQVADLSGNVGRAVRLVHVVDDHVAAATLASLKDEFPNTDLTGDDFSSEPDGVPDAFNDYDGDGMGNGNEIIWSFNPLDPESVGELPVLDGIGFFFVAGLVLFSGWRVLKIHQA